mgnify:CR=1 FL=1
MEKAVKQIRKIITDDPRARCVANEMLKTVLLESKSIIIRKLSGLTQKE